MPLKIDGINKMNFLKPSMRNESKTPSSGWSKTHSDQATNTRLHLHNKVPFHINPCLSIIKSKNRKLNNKKHNHQYNNKRVLYHYPQPNLHNNYDIITTTPTTTTNKYTNFSSPHHTTILENQNLLYTAKPPQTSSKPTPTRPLLTSHNHSNNLQFSSIVFPTTHPNPSPS